MRYTEIDHTATPEQIPVMRARYEAADQHVADLAAGRKQWRMCVPVQTDDSDITLSSSLRDVPALCDALEAAWARIDVLEQRAFDDMIKHDLHY